MQNSVPQSVTVAIYDQNYHLRGIDPQHIETLAQLVDSKMRAVSSQGATVDSLRVAVLAALNIADELMELRERHRELLDSLDHAETANRHRAHSLASMLDEALRDEYRVAV
ncbi:cell division protein ZapA [Terriglobus sp. ADX1]|uniref:cell division protein ZapA n=1 Tax=Terriglobus sp. ADX1 TaxID=2794063 RepID=UPI002FE67B6F